MTNTEADELGVLISQTWNKAAPPDIWAEELRDLDHTRATEAYRRLRREATHAPSIAQFFAVYRSLLGTDRRPERHCDACADTGMVTDTDHPHHWRSPRPMPTDDNHPGECFCNLVTWCKACPEGKRALAKLQAIDAARPPDPEPRNPGSARWPAA